MPVAFVLSGGGSLGAVQAGMVRALFERGIRPDFIVATSVGAVNAAFLASRPPTVETADALATVWRGLRRADIFPANLVTGFLGFIGLRSSFIPHTGLRAVLERHVELRRLEDATIPLHVIAVALQTGQERRLSAGDAVQAVLASAAIPSIFPPVLWNGELLIDGGVANNTPISHAVALGADEIYVLPAGFACDLTAPPPTAFGVGMHALSLLIHHRLMHETAALQGQVRLVVLPSPCPLDVTPIDFQHSDILIARGAAGARTVLDIRDSSGHGGHDHSPPST